MKIKRLYLTSFQSWKQMKLQSVMPMQFEISVLQNLISFIPKRMNRKLLQQVRSLQKSTEMHSRWMRVIRSELVRILIMVLLYLCRSIVNVITHTNTSQRKQKHQPLQKKCVKQLMNRSVNTSENSMNPSTKQMLMILICQKKTESLLWIKSVQIWDMMKYPRSSMIM